ncbi:RagB/SusD family nutrient uptake outer membrane protein [Gelidibacter pelagius]|uniref:RagB/SusD family nutrient uptake outer membrane protein n=1 Tax=Gelidibacter pelagius TaxID=2819985 RepID=A0ABS3SNQ9_9FLAO|nr:RagB/SusD family nutrient uptake outer membrane protein [Gelidibacter pelagius]MBO3097349.1 RagB/SusD family nutrient uptake outer membrane protein [Gelidibacter pelagius]
MKNNIKTLAIVTFIIPLFSLMVSCTFDEVVDPNGPSVDGVLKNASKGQLNELVVAIESTSRNGIGNEATSNGVLGRELYLFNAEPRNTGDLLGKDGLQLDNNSFYSVGSWNGNYRCIKNINLLLEAVANTDAVNESEKNGYIGYAKTMMASELIQILKSYGKARLDVADPENMGPIVEFNEGLAKARALLEEGQQSLSSAGSSFAFTLSNGFNGFQEPSTFSEFNRAWAGVAAVYAGDGNAALTALSNSYLDLAGDLDIGPKHIFGLGGGDQSNTVFKVPGLNGDQIIVHNSWIADAEAGDLRVEQKSALRTNPASQDGLNGTHETRLYDSDTSPIDFLRNEELILVYAEASILASNFQDAEDALNVIRNSANLPDYSGAQTAEALTAEMLKQRRYSLWSENHRMFDLRRYGLSNTLSIDRPGDQVFNTMPIPLPETY